MRGTSRRLASFSKLHELEHDTHSVSISWYKDSSFVNWAVSMQEQRSVSWQHEEIYAPLLRLQLGMFALRNRALSSPYRRHRYQGCHRAIIQSTQSETPAYSRLITSLLGLSSKRNFKLRATRLYYFPGCMHLFLYDVWERRR